jgi:SAM-dependent methyltransferase
VTACLRAEDGRALATRADRWLGPLTADDEAVLARAAPPVLDVGCGPGRHVLALAERGVLALGIDITPAALDLARRRGAPVLARSVFDRVPGAGRWSSALLLDGNLGIGGHPEALLERVTSLLAPNGTVLVEVEPPSQFPVAVASSGSCGAGRQSRRRRAPPAAERVRFDIGGIEGPWFAWTAVGADELSAPATAAGLLVDDVWQGGDRWFGALRRA